MKHCPDCGSKEIYEYKEDFHTPGSSSGEALLPGLGKNIFFTAKIRVKVCYACGLVRMYAAEDARRKLKSSKHWKHVKSV